jgi:predicted dienelactone hydrolase
MTWPGSFNDCLGIVSELLVPTARKREIPGIMPNPIASPVRKLSATVRPSQSPVVVIPQGTSGGNIAKLTLARPVATPSK